MPSKETIELLAPVGSIEAFWAALNHGADAIYLGAASFGARQNAGFDTESLAFIINTAHLYGVRVYITLNTLIKEHEFKAFLALAEQIHALGADAAIVQDLGVFRTLKMRLPSWPVHASTQMSVHTVHGALLLKSLGADRTVLARECSLDTLRRAAEHGIETEVFVHGALCVSQSGQCAFSSMIGGRSGNRGRCAQPCRQQYQYKNQAGAWLSPRDYNMLDHIQTLKASGVHSLKIEGRLKRAEYVATVTQAYRAALDAPLPKATLAQHQKSLTQIFNRGNFSSGYLFGNEDAAIMFPGHVSHLGVPFGQILSVKPMGDKYLATVRVPLELNNQDGLEVRGRIRQQLIYSGPAIPAGQAAILRLHQPAQVGDLVFRLDDAKLLEAGRASANQAASKKLPIHAKLTFMAKHPAMLEIRDTHARVTITGDIVEPAKSAPLDTERLQKSIEKTGDYPLTIVHFECDNPLPAFLPMQSINQLRRTAFEAFLAEKIRCCQPLQSKTNYTPKSPAQPFPFKGKFIVQCENIEQRDACKAIGVRHFFYAPRDLRNDNLPDALYRLDEEDAFVMPKQCTDDTLAYLARLIRQAHVNVVLQNIGQLGFDYPAHVLAGEGIYAWNTASISFLQEQGFAAMTLPLELTMEEMLPLQRTALPQMLMTYGRQTLMVLSHCPERVARSLSKGHKSCTLCNQNEGTYGQSLTDRLGVSFPLYPIHLPEGCINYLLDAKPLQLDAANDANTVSILRFTTETPQEMMEIISAYQTGNPLTASNPYIGRYQKGVE